jgi:hypothetical protein
MMTSDPSIAMEGITIVSASEYETKVRITVENRGKASVNSQTPISFYYTAINPTNQILTTPLNQDIFPDNNATLEYVLQGDFRGKIIYVRLVDDGSFPAKGHIDCDPTNNIAYTMQVSAVDDYFSIPSNNIAYLDIIKNDVFNKNVTPQIEVIESAHNGLSLVASGSQISYLPNPGFQGIDSIRYRIRCTDNNFTVSDEATAYILVLKPSTLEYAACPGATVQVDINPVADIEYNWYDSETGGNILQYGKNTTTINFVKGAIDETLWVQTEVKGFAVNRFPRFKINILLASNCNSDKPSDCVVNGTLLFHDDFGGNSPSDNKIVTNGLIYESQLDDLCEATTLNISTWITNVAQAPVADKTNLIFTVEDLNGNMLSKYHTGDLDDSNRMRKSYGFSFTIPYKVSSLVLKIINNSSTTSNTGFVIDDVMIHLCIPKAVLTDNGARELCIGTVHDFNGTFTDNGFFGNNLVYRLEFRENKNNAWKVIKTDKQTGGVVNMNESVSIISDGYYRFVVGGENINCAAISDEIFLKSKDCNVHIMRDSALVLYNDSARFDVRLNDRYLCNNGALDIFDTIAGSGLHLGRLIINADSTFTYIADKDVSGIDSVDYMITCNGTSENGRVYIFVNKPVPLHYACAGNPVKIGFPLLPGATYSWYDKSSGGNIVGNVVNDSLTTVKGSAEDIAVWWIQPEWNGIVFQRFAITLQQADDCGDAIPSACLTNGTLLFHDDFVKFPQNTGKQFYSKRIDGLCEDTELLFTIRISGVSNRANLILTLEDSIQNIYAQYSAGDISGDKQKKNYGFKFRIPENHSSYVLKIINNGAVNNNFVIDNVEIRLCTPKITIADIVSDTLVCESDTLTLNGNYPDAGNTFGKDIAYRWEFRHIDSAKWKILAEGHATPPLNVTLKITNVDKFDKGYYRLRVSKRENIDSPNCCALSDSIHLIVIEKINIADIRVQLAPIPKRVINLTSFLDSISYSNIHWDKSIAPPILSNTTETTGSINSTDFNYTGVYTYIYTVATKCGSSTAKVYIRTVKDKIFRMADTITICGTHESSKSLNLNHILGLELGGILIYDDSVNPDSTVFDNVTKILSPSKYAGAFIFNATKAWNTAPQSYSILYKNYNEAKIFKFIYIPPKGSTITTEKKLAIVVTG